MNQWTKFEDCCVPGDIEYIWVSDGIKVWPDRASGIMNEKTNIYWMPRQNPAPPERKHYCCNTLFDVECAENIQGNLWLQSPISRNQPTFFSFPVYHCPFCAYTIEKKIHD